MPELPEVENIVRDLRPKLCGKTIKMVQVARPTIPIWPQYNFAKLSRNKTILKLSRKGKCIVLELSNGYEILIHLGMTGQLLYRRADQPMEPYAYQYTCLIFHLHNNNDRHELRLADMRRFGRAVLRKQPKQGERPNLVDELGPDALTVGLKGFRACFSGRKGILKGLLLNQRIISGLGNIYTDESLFRAGIHPLRKANTLSDNEIKKLHAAVRQVLKAAIASGGSTVDTYRLPDGRKGAFQEQHMVYQRQGKPCLRCKASIVRLRVAGRGTYLCLKCQNPQGPVRP